MAKCIEKRQNDICWKCLPDVQLTLGTPVNDFQRYLLPYVSAEWKTRKLGCKTFDAGITNALYAIFDADKGLSKSRENVVLIRVNGFGTDKFICRADEIISLITLNKHGLSPPLYAECANGLCYGFQPGRHLVPTEFAQSNIMRLNAQAMASLHAVEIPTAFKGRGPQVWIKCDQWIEEAPCKFDDPTKQKYFEDGIGSIDNLRRELNEMKDVLSQYNSVLVFCHNDLLCGNFIYDESKESMKLIDFEYAGPNYLAYDIGNHFCEFAGIDNVNYDLYPSEAVQKEWLTYYLEETAKIKGQDSVAAPTEQSVHSLYCEVNKFALSAHLFWTVWALIQAVHSEIDFNYAEYAGIRFAEYKQRKREFLAL